jgi:cleavage and polyadenylation specificity factor subunit 2
LTGSADSITGTLRASGSVLIPVDASTRLIELLVILDQHWTQTKARAPLCLVSRTGQECVAFVRSLMEWMGGWITREGEVPTLGKDSKKRKRRNRRDEEDLEEEDALLANMILRFKYGLPMRLLIAIF